MQVNWTEEQPCFDTIARALAGFYSELPLVPEPPAARGEAETPEQQRQAEAHRNSRDSAYYIVGYNYTRATATRDVTNQQNL